jgi:hypothetical protein
MKAINIMIVAHDDKKHFHIHIMLNKVHLETLRAHTPYRDWFTLDAAVRFLEAKHGWAHTPGPMRWDEESNRLYCNRDPSAMRFDLSNNIRLEPLHNLNITRIRNHSRPMCDERLLRAWAHCLRDGMSHGMTCIAFSRRRISDLRRENQADIPSLPLTTTSG